MARPARQRETLHSRAIYRFHPMFAHADFARYYYGDDDANHQPATVEGGDVHVLGHGAVMVGMGERTTPMAVELLAGALFRGGQASRVIAVELPASRAMMHLDTVMTMLDRATFVQYPYLERQPRSWTLTPNGDDYTVSVMSNHDLWETGPGPDVRRDRIPRRRPGDSGGPRRLGRRCRCGTGSPTTGTRPRCWPTS